MNRKQNENIEEPPKSKEKRKNRTMPSFNCRVSISYLSVT